MPEHSLFIVRSPEDPGGIGRLLEPSDNPVAQAYRTGLYDAGIPAIVFSVADVRAEYERLSAKGMRFTGEPQTDQSGTHVVYDDICGNFVQIHQD